MNVQRLKNVLILMCIYSCISFGSDIVDLYLYDVSEYITILFHFIHVMLLIHFCKQNSFSLRNKVKKIKISYAFVSIVLGLLIICLFDVIDISYIIEGVYRKSKGENTFSFFYSIYLLIYASFIAPIVEEIEFRGILLSELHNAGYSSVFVLFLSSLMFMAIHTGTIHTSAFVLGIVSGVMLLKTGNLVYSILIHFSGNFALCLLILVSQFSSNKVMNNDEIKSDYNEISRFPLYIIFFVVVAFLLVCVCEFLKKKYDKTNLISKKDENKNQISIIKYVVFYFLVCFFSTMIQYEF